MSESLDYYMNTVEHDTVFHAFMDRLFGPEWRDVLTPEQKRMEAKKFNFMRLYSLGPMEIRGRK